LIDEGSDELVPMLTGMVDFFNVTPAPMHPIADLAGYYVESAASPQSG
jgi:hypothetical protein